SRKTLGFLAPIFFSCFLVHGNKPLSSLTPKLAAEKPTGSTPKASGISWFPHWIVTTRCGFCLMTVVPNLFLILMGYWLSLFFSLAFDWVCFVLLFWQPPTK